jgi:hypothetical protein
MKVRTRYYYADDTIELDISARVPQGYTPSYRAEGLPQGASYDQTTGLFTWTPNESQRGIHEITFIAYYENFETTQMGTIIIL